MPGAQRQSDGDKKKSVINSFYAFLRLQLFIKIPKQPVKNEKVTAYLAYRESNIVSTIFFFSLNS
jgi:hypothetical protein